MRDAARAALTLPSSDSGSPADPMTGPTAMFRRLRHTERPTRFSPLAVALLLLAGSMGIGGATALAAQGYSYFFGYGTPDCPSSTSCPDPEPRVRQMPVRDGIMFYGDAVNGSLFVQRRSAGPGTLLQLRADREPPTKAGRGMPAAPAGTSMTPVADYLDYELVTGNPGSPKVRSYWLQHRMRISPDTPQLDTVPGVQAGVPASEVTVHLLEDGRWRELPRFAANTNPYAGPPLPYNVDEGYVVGEWSSPTTPRVSRWVTVYTKSPAATVGVFRRVALPPAPPQPAPQPAAPRPAPAPPRIVLSLRGVRADTSFRLTRRGAFTVPCEVIGAPRATCSFTATATVRNGRLVRTTSGRKRKGTRSVTVARGTATYAGKPARVAMRLTTTGRRLMRRYRRVPVALRQEVAAVGATPVSRTARASLLRARKR